MNNDIGTGDFYWFIGIIEDVMDPMMLGRVKVRIINDYENTVVNSDIPWAMTLGSSSSANKFGIGFTTVGMDIGTLVIGFFLDGDRKTKPMVLGTMSTVEENDTSSHSFSEYARGIAPVHKEYLDYEPKSEYAAQYPYNKVLATKSGHVIEIDDTPTSERIHIYHSSGSYIEIFPNGKMVIKSEDDSMDISMGDKAIISDSGSMNIAAFEKVEIVSENSGCTLVGKETVGIASVNGNVEIAASENIKLEAGSTITIDGPDIEITGNVVAKNNFNIKGNLVVDGDLSVKGKVKGKNADFVGSVNVTGSLKLNGKQVLTA